MKWSEKHPILFEFLGFLGVCLLIAFAALSWILAPSLNS